jgi:hypothetical protein
MQQGLVFRFLRRQLDSCSSVLLACDAGCLHSTTELNPADYGEREREIEISSPLARSLACLAAFIVERHTGSKYKFGSGYLRCRFLHQLYSYLEY